jgi:hypothetical protein
MRRLDQDQKALRVQRQCARCNVQAPHPPALARRVDGIPALGLLFICLRYGVSLNTSCFLCTKMA